MSAHSFDSDMDDYWLNNWDQPAMLLYSPDGKIQVSKVNCAADIFYVICLAINEENCQKSLDQDWSSHDGLASHGVIPETMGAILKHHPEQSREAFNKLSLFFKNGNFENDAKFYLFAYMTRCLRQNRIFETLDTQAIETLGIMAEFANTLNIEKNSTPLRTFSQTLTINTGKNQFYYAQFHKALHDRLFYALEDQPDLDGVAPLIESCVIAAARHLDAFPNTRFTSAFPHAVLEHSASDEQLMDLREILEKSYIMHIKTNLHYDRLNSYSKQESLRDLWEKQTIRMVEIYGEENREIIEASPLPYDADLVINRPRTTPGGEVLPRTKTDMYPTVITNYRPNLPL